MNLRLSTFQQKALPKAMFAWLTLFVSLAAWLGSAQDATAQAPYKGSELFVYHMVGNPPYANRTPACMKFVSFTQPVLNCPPPPPTDDPPSGGGGGGQSDQGGGLTFIEEAKSMMAPPPPGGVFDAFDKDIIGTSFYSTNGSCSWTSDAARLTICPNKGSNTIINGFFFEYGVSMTGGGAAGISKPTLRVLVNGVLVYTQSFQSSDRYNGFYAAFPASLNTTAWEGKNVTFEITDVREHIIDDFAIIGTNNCTEKVCLGNLVWEDTNANGVRDAGEIPRANVKIQIFRDNNNGKFELPTKDYLFEDGRDGLIAETTTDANGNYNVCVPKGDYFVRITPDNFDIGKPLSGCFPTIGPSVTGNSDQDNKDHADVTLKPAYKGIGLISTLVTLASGAEPTTDGNDANTNSTIDFGVMCDATKLMNLGNLVWKDTEKNGIKDASEEGFAGIKLVLYTDINANGVYDIADVKVGETTTDANGNYNFGGLMPSNYILTMPASNFQNFYGIAWGWQLTPVNQLDPNTNIDNDNNGMTGTLEPVFTKAINLTFAQEPTTDGDGNNGNLTLDIGLYKGEVCIEYLTTNSYSTTRSAFNIYDKNGNFVIGNSGNGSVTALNYDWDKNIFLGHTSANATLFYFYKYTIVRDTINDKLTYSISDVTGTLFASTIAYNFSSAPDGFTYYSSGGVIFRLIPLANGTYSSIAVGSHPGTTFMTIDKNMDVYGMKPSKINRKLYDPVNQDWNTTTATIQADFPAGYTYYSNNSTQMNENYITYIPRYDRVYMLALNLSTSKVSIVSIPAGFSDTTTSRVEINLNDLPNYTATVGPLSTWATVANHIATDFAYVNITYDPYSNRLIIHARKGYTSTENSRMYVFDLDANGQVSYSFNAITGVQNGPGIYPIPCGGGGGGTPPPAEISLKLGNRVWNDVNNNGLIDGTETGIANVGLVLYKDNGDGVLDRLTDARWDSTTTDASGYYLFDKLPNGDYYVLLPNHNFLSGKALYGKFSSTPTVAEPNTDIDNDDNGINPTMAQSHVNDGIASGKITLLYENEPINDGDDKSGNMTVDFGFYTPQPNVDNILRVGNRVWNDVNNNIKVDAGETYFDGVKLSLLKDDGDLLFDATKDLVQATTTTAGGGFYLFDKLLPGNYYVRVDKENFDAGKVLDKYRSSTGYYGANTCFDSTDHGNEAAFAWWIDGVLSSYISLEPHQEPPAYIDGDDDNGNMNIDFGFYRPVRLGNRVWKDTNKNGKRDAGEPDINGVLVNAYKDDGDGVFELNQDIYVGMRTTQDSGYYNFHDLIPGSYFVQIPSSNFGDAAALENMISTPGVVGENPAANNQDHGIDNATPVIGGIVSQIVVLAYDQEPPATVDTDNADGNFTIDFGFIPNDGIDLALKKVLGAGQSKSYKVGDTIKFTIKVYNQGINAASNIQLTDYIPAGLTLADANWTTATAGKTTLVTPIASLVAGDSTSRDISFTVSNTATGVIKNSAEISSVTGTDVDSTPDNDATNDGTATDNELNGQRKIYATDDEDDADYEEIYPYIDLALTKKLATGQAEVVAVGANVTFTISIINQGTVEATNVQITDYVPAGLVPNDANWTNMGNGKYQLVTPIVSIPAGQTVTKNFAFTVTGVYGNVTNYAEISSMDGEDIDSTPDDKNDNDGTPVDDVVTGNHKTTPSADEDDHDLAVITVKRFDLALKKTLATGQASTVNPSADVKFTITVYNQGTADASNIQVTDYIPTGMTLNDANWTAVGNKATLKTPIAALAAGQSTTVDIILKVNAGLAAGSLTNFAEVSSATGGTDVDSTPDANGTNDGTPTDDVITGNHKTNPSEDEDDHDLASVTVNAAVDVALRKTLATGQSRNVARGGNVTFTMTVYNQGNVAVTNLRVYDYIPTGLTLNDADWQLSGTSAYTKVNFASIAPGDSAKIDITFTVAATAVGAITNAAEVSSFTGGTDIDSTPNTTSTDDGNPKDNVINEDGKNTTGDEDDHDIETIVITDGPRFDLALRKTTDKAAVRTGDTVVFTISIFNQGNTDATNVQITDYIPTGLTLADATWTDNAGKATLNTPIASIAAGATVTRDIKFTVNAGVTGTVTNTAEISAATGGTDIDSTPDDLNTNDGTVKNDVITEDRKTTSSLDEDDHDTEVLTVTKNVDIALRKTLAAGQSRIVSAGGTAKFTITVYNQGTEALTNIRVYDYIPTGLTLNDANWTASGTTLAYIKTNIASLAAGDSVKIDINFNVSATATGTLTNAAEVQSFTGGTDVDSTPDATSTNDGTVKNDVIDEDYKAATTTNDQDDHDIESIEIITNPIFDLALTKTVNNSVVTPGQSVTFNVNVINQGDVTATNVQVTDYIPAGLTLNDANWAAVGGKATLVTPIASIIAGQTVTKTITFTVNAAATGNITNYAEISAATGGTDKDSTPDADNTNDGTPQDDITSGDRKTNPNEDEDDHDFAVLVIPTAPEFDLALTKKLAAGQSASVVTGGTVKFTISVINQGNVDATNVQVTDYIPTGLTLNDANWAAAGGKATLVTPITTLAAGATMTRDITFTVGTTIGAIINTAEISAATGGTDKDSTPDADGTNDGTPKNDVIDEDRKTTPANDEDDSDPETITVTDAPVFDLALTKKLATGQSATVNTGGTVKFTISVINQGTVDASNVQVTDYIPTGLTLNDANWTAAAGKATLVTPIATLAAGATVTRDITFNIGATTGILNNVAEISAATGGTDIDSTPDSDLNNDGTPKNDVINENGKTGGDEDDADFEPITVTASCVTPTFKSIVIRATCSGTTANSDAKIALTNIVNGDKAAYSQGSTYTGGAYSAATAITGGAVTFSGITNLAGNNVYTVRVFNGSDACFQDRTMIIPVSDCNTLCTVDAGNDMMICNPISTVDLKDAASTEEWILGTGNPAAAIINASTGVISGMTVDGIYSFILRDKVNTSCSDMVYVFRSMTILPTLSSCETTYQLPTNAGITWTIAAGNTASVTAAGLITGMTTNGTYTFNATFGACITTVDVAKVSCACVTPNAGADFTMCLPKTGTNLIDAPSGYEWVVGSGNPAAATINATTGVISGMTTAGIYKFNLQKTGEATCFDEIQITVNNGDVPIVLCNDGSTSYNVVAQAGLTNVVWYNMAGVQVGTGTTLVVKSTTLGLEDGTEAFYYIGQNGTASGCDVELCCPVKFLTQTCCPVPNCVNVTIIKN